MRSTDRKQSLPLPTRKGSAMNPEFKAAFQRLTRHDQREIVNFQRLTTGLCSASSWFI